MVTVDPAIPVIRTYCVSGFHSLAVLTMIWPICSPVVGETFVISAEPLVKSPVKTRVPTAVELDVAVVAVQARMISAGNFGFPRNREPLNRAADSACGGRTRFAPIP